MRPIVAVLIAAVVASGCATARQTKVAAQTTGLLGGVAGAGALLVGGVVVLDCVGTGISCESATALRTAKIFAVSGLVLLVAGAFGYGIVDSMAKNQRAREWERHSASAPYKAEVARQREELERLARERNDRERNRSRAWLLTKEAAESARAGDCAVVVARGREVFALDVEVHYTVFARDVAIGGCLAKAGIPTAIVQPAPPRDRTKDREHAFGLTKAAADAARAGNCTTALENAEKVRELDINVHDAWFVRNAAIKACLDVARRQQHVPPDTQPAPPGPPESAR